MIIDYLGHKMSVNYNDDIGSKIISDGEWEPDIRRLLEEHIDPGDTVVDIGANLGTHTLTMAREVGDAGTVYAFEPHPETSERLETTLTLNGLDHVQFRRVAITATPGVVTLTEMRENDSGMVTTRDLEPWEDDVDTFEVPGVTLDSIDGHIDFAKMDIEGAEVDVVPTLDLDRIDWMLIELHDFAYTGSEKADLMNYLRQHGEIVELEREVLWH